MTAQVAWDLSVVPALQRQARGCAAIGSPLYAAILQSAADDFASGGPVRDFFSAAPQRAALSVIGIRLMAAVHRCALDGSAPDIAACFPSCGGRADAAKAWPAVRTCIRDRAADLGRIFESTPQTNEVARSTLLLAGLLAVAAHTKLPVRLLDAGASAGLNARLDRYAYAGIDWTWGDPSSPLTLRNTSRAGRPRYLEAALNVVERAACDLNPMDITNDEDRLALRSFVWPDQLERFERLNRAIEAASPIPLVVEAADMFEWIPQRLVPCAGTVTVCMHSIVAEHLSDDARTRLYNAIAAAASHARTDAPLAWMRFEAAAGRYETRVTIWPQARELAIARSNPHGQSIEWNVSA